MSTWAGWPEQWPGRGVATPGGGTGTQTPLPVCSLQVPLGAIPPAGAACGTQVVVAL